MKTREQVEQSEAAWRIEKEEQAAERRRDRDAKAAAKGSKPPVYGVDVDAPPCPLCKSKTCQVVGASVRYVYCQRCRMTGPSCGSDAEAIEFWAGLSFGGRDWNQEEESNEEEQVKV